MRANAARVERARELREAFRSMGGTNDDAVFQDVSVQNLEVRGKLTGGGGGTFDTEQLLIGPPVNQYGAGVNMPTGTLQNYVYPGLDAHSVVIVKGADNQATRLGGLDATGVPDNAFVWLVNLSQSGTDCGQVVLEHLDPGSLFANQFRCPGNRRFYLPIFGGVLLHRSPDVFGTQWHVVTPAGWANAQSMQQLQFYPNIEVPPLVGVLNDWAPDGLSSYGAGQGLAGGDLQFKNYSLIRCPVDIAGATITGIAGVDGSNGQPQNLGPVKILINYGPGTLTLANLNGGSAVEHRLNLPFNRDMQLGPGSAAMLISPMGDPNPLSQWRVVALGASNEVFPSVNTTGRTTTQSLTLGPQNTVALAAGVNSNVNIGDQATINFTTNANGSICDGMVPGQPLVGNEVRLLRNAGPGPLAIVPELGSASAVNNRFVLPNGRAWVIPPIAYALVQYIPAIGKWYLLDQALYGQQPWSITPAAFAAGNVIDYAPTDATTGWNGRYAGVWYVSGAVGTNLCGIDPQPAGFPPYVDQERVLVINGLSGFTVIHNSGANVNAGSRIILPGGANKVIAQFGALEFIRNTGSNAWTVNLPA